MDSQAYRTAQKRVKKKKEFYSHLRAFILVNVGMMFLLLFRGRPLAFMPATFFWGIGLAFHYASVFGLPGMPKTNSDEWERREIEKELRRMGTKPSDEHAPQRPPLPDPEQSELDKRLELKELRRDYDERDLV
jgi:hypothetical protein